VEFVAGVLTVAGDYCLAVLGSDVTVPACLAFRPAVDPFGKLTWSLPPYPSSDENPRIISTWLFLMLSVAL